MYRAQKEGKRMLENYSIENKMHSTATIFDVHLHENFEVNFILSDSVEVIAEDKFYDSKKGDVFIFPPFTFHKLDSKNKRYKRFLMYFDENEMLSEACVLAPALKMLKNSSPAVIHLNEPQCEKLTDLFLEAEKCYTENRYNTDFKNISAFGNIIIYILDNLDSASISASNKAMDNKVSKILRYVNENIAEDLTVEGIAEHFNISYTSLYNLMQQSLGISMKDYILKIRISKAVELLPENLSISEISSQCGFNNYSHFIRTFTKIIGVSPNKYKAKLFEIQKKTQKDF